MDGTLLNSNHEVSQRFFEIFKELQKRNITFVAASGRQYHSMVDKLSSIKDEIIVIAENGALVKQQENILLTTPIHKSEVNRILETLAPLENVHPVLCCQNNAFVGSDSDAFITMLKEYYSEFRIVEDRTNVDEEVLKIAIYHFESSEKYIYPAVKHLENENRNTLKIGSKAGTSDFYVNLDDKKIIKKTTMTSETVSAIVQARMGSSRLPGKVLKNFGNETALSLLIKRLKKCEKIDDIVVATSIENKDEPIIDWCINNNIPFYRGSEKDVLDRVVKAHEYMIADIFNLIGTELDICEKIDDRWNIGVSTSKTDKFEQISFVNGIATFKGGKHVDYICKLIITGMSSGFDSSEKFGCLGSKYDI